MKLFKCLAVAGITTLITSCQSTVFGVDQEVWKTLNEEQRTEAIRSYNKIKEMEAQERIEAARQKRKHEEFRSAEAEKNAKVIRVILKGGEITKGKLKHDLNYAETVIKHGSSSYLDFESSKSKEHSLRSCKISYKKGILKIGSTNSSLEKAIELEFNDAWKDGVNYKHLKFPLHADYDGWINLYITTKKDRDDYSNFESENGTGLKFKLGK